MSAALFPSFPQLMPFVIRPPAVAPMMLDRFMQVVFCVLDPPLALVRASSLVE
jgi:hypothetical protein